MRILKAELKKMISMPMLWVFIAVCCAFNISIIFIYQYKIVDYPYFSYVKDIAAASGNVLGSGFSEKLSDAPDSAQKKRLVSETQDIFSIYADYDTGELANAYIGLYEISGAGADMLTEKYERLKTAVESLNRTGAEFSLYSAGETVRMHKLLFGVVLRAVVTECCILAALTMLYLCGYEYQNKTEFTVYTTKIGRRLYKYKFCAGMILSVIYFILITCATLLIYFSAFDYSQLWSASVSSGFNYISGMIGVKPFITWIPFTVKGYLLAVLGLGLILTLIFAMMGAFIGFILRNSYLGTLIFFLISFAMMTVPYIFSQAGIWSVYFILQFSPVRIWFVIHEWFTDLGSVSVIPFHETAGTVFNILFWGVLMIAAYEYVKRKDVI